MHKYVHIPSIINVWTPKYGEPRLYDNRETIIITITLYNFKKISIL